MQENGYYPFGGEIRALTTNAGGVANRHKFNAGTELNEFFDINLYETPFRRYDATTGRFTGVDMLCEWTWSKSPYQFGINNPISYNDPTGLALSMPSQDEPSFDFGGMSLWSYVGYNTGIWSNSSGFEIGGEGISAGGGGSVESKLIGKSKKNELGGSDASFGFEGDPGTVGIGKLSQKSNDELKGEMQNLIDWLSKGDLADVGRDMVNRFSSNAGGAFSSYALAKAVHDHPDFIVYKNNIIKQFHKQLRENRGDINKVSLKPETRPDFNRLSDYINGLKILINDTELVEFYLEDFSFNSKTGDYHAILRFVIYDDFGLDDDDVRDLYSDKNIFAIQAITGINPIPGFQAWWLLQHQRGNQPLTTIVENAYEFSGNINITNPIVR